MNVDVETSELGQNLTFRIVKPIVVIYEKHVFFDASQKIHFL